jgi:hypothetical protein
MITLQKGNSLVEKGVIVPWRHEIYQGTTHANGISNLLTPWSRVLLENLAGLQLVKKCSAFYRTRRFITAFTSARQLSISWGSSIQSIHPHTTSWRSMLLLLSHLRLGLPSGLFPSGFTTKRLYTTLPSPIRATCHAHHILLVYIVRKIFSEEYRSWSSSLWSFLHPPVTTPLRPKYSPQHPILKYPRPTFLPQCQRPSFTPKIEFVVRNNSGAGMSQWKQTSAA